MHLRNPLRRRRGTGHEPTPLENTSTTSGQLLLLHWGNSGAGPRILYELARAIPGEVHLSYNLNAEIASELSRISASRLEVETYHTKAGVLVKLPLLVLHSLRVRRYIRRNGITAVFTPMFNLWQSIAVPFMIPRDVIFVSTVHDANPHPGDSQFLARIPQRVERWRSDAIITFSESVARDVRAGTSVPVVATVHPAFGEVAVHHRQLPDARPVKIGFFGRILHYKGLDLLSDAYEMIGQQLDCELVVAGDGDINFVESLGLSPRIQMDMRWIPESEVNSIVASFDILVLPYREASQSGVLAVALAEGVPVVVTPVGALPEQIAGTGAGKVSSEVTACAIADAILALCDPETYQRSSVNALRAARSAYSWDAAVQGIDEALRVSGVHLDALSNHVSE